MAVKAWAFHIVYQSLNGSNPDLNEQCNSLLSLLWEVGHAAKTSMHNLAQLVGLLRKEEQE